jgi:hypothetical protein
MRPADRAWLAIIAAVLAYEIAASRRRHDWELLSEACDRYRTRHPVVVRGVIVYLAAHLTRTIPARLDPLHQFATRIVRP